MKKLILICMLLSVGASARAQERQAGLQATYVHSPGTGNTDGVGLKAEAVLPLTDFLTAVTELGWVIEPKAYLGNGQALRGRAELRIAPFTRGKVRPYLAAGGSAVRQWTSAYRKSAFNPTVSFGVNWGNCLVPYWKHFLVERQTQNRVAADEFGAGLYLPLDDSRWLVRTSLSTINTRFSQPAGFLNAGRYSVWAWQMSAGFARRF